MIELTLASTQKRAFPVLLFVMLALPLKHGRSYRGGRVCPLVVAKRGNKLEDTSAF